MKLDFTQVTDTSYLNQGGVYVFEIDAVTSKQTPTGTDYIELAVHDVDSGALHTERLYMTGNAVPYSVKKLKHIGTKFTTEDAINDCTSTEDINELFKGKRFRAKVRVEEYTNTNGEVRKRFDFGLPPFAEAVTEGGEYPPISEEQSKLKYDPARDYKSLEPAPEGEGSGAPSGGLY